LRRGAQWKSALVVLLAAACWCAAASADSVLLDDHATFRWPHSVGPYNGYEVLVAKNGGPLQLRGLTQTPEWTVTSEPNDVISVAVRAYALPLGPNGPRVRSETSELSDPVRLLGETSALGGVLALENRSSGHLELRSISSGGTPSTLTSLRFPGSSGTGWELLQLGGLTGSRRTEALLRDSATGALWLGELSPSGVKARTLLWGVGLPTTRPLVGDFDGDGRAEIALRYPQTEVVVIWKLVNERFTAVASLPAVAGAPFVSTRDFDGDGRSDLWFEASDGRLSVYPIPQLRIDKLISIPSPLLGYDVADVADYDGDGRPDVLWRSSTGALMLARIRGTVTSPGFLMLQLAALAPNGSRIVRTSGDRDGVAGAEIYTQNLQTGAVDVVFPMGSMPGRSQRLLDPGTSWRLVQAF
jgi:hypothetical protein